MKPIEAKNQVRLGPARCLQLALTGMSFRLFRSGITMAILALAVAFLVHMLAYGLIAREVQDGAWAELGRSREMGALINRLTEPDTRPVILEQFAKGDAGRLAEYRRWGGLSNEEHAWAQRAAVRYAAATRMLQELPEDQKTVLLGDREPRQLFEALADEAEYAQFIERLEQVGVRPPLGSEAEFKRLVQEQRPRLSRIAGRVRAGHEAAIAAVRQAYPDRSAQKLAEAPPTDFVATLRGAGYSVSEADLPDLVSFAAYVRDRQAIAELVVKQEVRAAVARETDLPLSEVSLDTVLRAIDGEGRAAWFAGVAQQARGAETLTAERLLEVADRYRRETKLQGAVGGAEPAGDAAFMGLSERSLWLIGLSFIVCVVGVANAMLMSVTERFTEIATMKCLGAMDRFVMMMFVFEAVIQGVVGGVIGLALGVLLALLRSLAEFGTLVFEAGSALGDIALATLLSLAVGIVLAAVAAVGPSWIAARLAPMEAMRVE